MTRTLAEFGEFSSTIEVKFEIYSSPSSFDNKVSKTLDLSSNIKSSTPIIDTRNGKMEESKGYVPERSVVVPGTKEKEVSGGKIYTSCAYIIGERKPSTDLKTSLNNVLREFALSV